MSERRFTTELKVGFFTLVGLIVLATVALVLDGNPFAKRSQTYYTELDNVGGVGQRTQVRTSGVQVGEVVNIDILPKGARVNFSVDSQVVIPKGSHVEIRSRGILGDVYIEIVRKEDETEALPQGAHIPRASNANDISSLMAAMGGIAKDVKEVTKTLAEVFGSPSAKGSLKNILTNVETMTHEAKELVAGERVHVASLIRNLKGASEKLAYWFDRNDERIEVIMANIAAATHDVRQFTEQIKHFAKGENKDRLENIIVNVDKGMATLLATTEKIQGMVAKVERGEGTLGQLLAKDDTANELKESLRSVQEFLKPAMGLKVEVDYKGELRVKPPTMVGRYGNHLNVRLRTSPDKMYILGVSDAPTSRTITQTRTETSNCNPEAGVPCTKVIEEKLVPEDRGRLRWNLQFGKRYDHFGVRVGLFESYAGLAGDIYLLSDRLTASLEMFHFGNSDEEGLKKDPKGFARIKLYSNFFMTPNFFVTAGVDHLGRSPRAFPYAGLGLRFSDDDLKSVAGAASMAK